MRDWGAVEMSPAGSVAHIHFAQTALFRYGLALLAVASAILCRNFVDPDLMNRMPMGLYVIAILLAARFGGTLPGLVAAGVSLIALVVGASPSTVSTASASKDLFTDVLFAGVSAGIILICGQLQDALTLSQRERRQFREITNCLPAFVWTATPDGLCDFMNNRWYDYCGAKPGSALGEGWAKVIHAEDLPVFMRQWECLRGGVESGATEVRVRGREGTWRWFEMRLAAVLDEQREVVQWIGSYSDVDERHRLREKTVADAERFAQVAASAPGALCRFELLPDGTTRLLFATGAFEEMFGIRPEELVENAECMFARIHPDELAGVQAAIAESARTMCLWQQEFRYTHELRGEIWLCGQSAPAREPDGGTTWVGFITDVTEQKRAEAILHERTRRELNVLQTLVRNAPLSMAIFDRRMRYIETSQEWNDDLAPHLATLKGRLHFELFPRLPAPWVEAHRRGLAGETTSGHDDRFEALDGSEHWANWVVMPWGDAGEMTGGIVVYCDDVTERIRTGALARQWQHAFEHSQTAISLGNAADDTIVAINDAYARLLRSTPQELMGRRYADLYRPEAQLRRTESLRNASNGHAVFESSMVRKDGTEFPVLVDITELRDAGGQKISRIGIVQDLTEIRKADAELRSLNATLEERVRQRTTQLQAANQELEAFSYSVSHDLRAPLRGIEGWSLALLEDYGAQLDERGLQYLHQVRANAQLMGNLIDDLLRLSRISGAALEREPVDISELARGVAAKLQNSHPARKLDFRIAPELNARGDRRLLEVALTNLFGNAVKFTGTRKNAQIRFEARNCAGHLEYYVHDNGVGFDEAYKDKLFSAFQRLHSANEFPGSGIGLATVKRIVDRHGGDVWATGVPGLGATFGFTLDGPRAGSTNV